MKLTQVRGHEQVEAVVKKKSARTTSRRLKFLTVRAENSTPAISSAQLRLPPGRHEPLRLNLPRRRTQEIFLFAEYHLTSLSYDPLNGTRGNVHDRSPLSSRTAVRFVGAKI